MGLVRRAWVVLLLVSGVAWGQSPAMSPTLPNGAGAGLQERLKAIMANPAALKAAVEAGRKASFFCANCHGDDGNSKAPDVPNLAGQNPAYLVEQIRKFAAGERKNPFMQGMIKLLKEEERLQIALYFAEGKAKPSQGDTVLASRGRDIFTKNCVPCHGEAARGNEAIPRLASQKPQYLQSSIVRYRDRTGERNSDVMASATARLKQDEVVAVANYLTQLP